MGERKERSQRNKIVSTLTSVATSAAGLDAIAIVPPGTGAAVAFVCGVASIVVNIWWPR